MKSVLKFASVAAVGAISLAAGVAAKADVIVSAGRPNMCIDVNQTTFNVALWGCHGGANQNFFSQAYGAQSFNGRCLDMANPNQGANIVMAPCQNKPSQRWLLVTNLSDPNNGRFRNEAGWCINIPGANASQGAQLIAWHCQQGTAAWNDMWARGRFGSTASVGVPAALVPQLMQPGKIFAPNAAGIVAAGAGNVVAAGAGNVVAAGAGNAIQLNGGAIVAAGAGNIVAAGGGNFTGR